MTGPTEYAEAFEITGKTAQEFDAWIHSFKEVLKLSTRMEMRV